MEKTEETEKIQKVRKSDAEWRSELTPEQYQVAREAGTERAFTGCYWDTKQAGTYHCSCCDLALFASGTKYDSGSGWPSFFAPLDPARVQLLEDRSHGMVRTEVRCAACEAHLGHLFDDGPAPTGKRFCMNSVSLHLKPSSS